MNEDFWAELSYMVPIHDPDESLHQQGRENFSGIYGEYFVIDSL